MSSFSHTQPDAQPLSTMVYGALRAIAQRHLAGERREHTLQPTALAHEAYLRLSGREEGFPLDSAQFLVAATVAMRSILVDHARRRAAQKRGGGLHRTNASEELFEAEQAKVDVLALHESLERLRELDPQLAHVVELRYFGGLGDADIADVLKCSTRSVRRAWSVARTWLARELQP
jgi:RNA polymerase sigma factor (TIGR02999 family)